MKPSPSAASGASSQENMCIPDQYCGALRGSQGVHIYSCRGIPFKRIPAPPLDTPDFGAHTTPTPFNRPQHQ